MTRYIFIPLLLFICTSSCNNETRTDADSDLDTSKPVAQNFIIDSSRLIDPAQMRMSFQNFIRNFRRGDSIITKFQVGDLKGLLNSMSDTDTVKFIVGMSTNTIGMSTDTSYRNRAVIFVRIPARTATTTTYSYVEGDLCPPPPGCNIEN
jgi:hypothetical protein